MLLYGDTSTEGRERILLEVHWTTPSHLLKESGFKTLFLKERESHRQSETDVLDLRVHWENGFRNFECT